MSYRSRPHHSDPGQPADHWAYEYPAQHRDPHYGHAPQPRVHQQPQAPKQRQRNGLADYMLVHGRRQVRLGPVAFWIVVGSLVIMAGWSILTGTYFAFHDDVLKRLIARQAEMQYAYEDRIAELRAQVDRITSRQLLDQEQFEQKLEALVRKQSTLEQRASTLGSLPDYTPTGSIPKPARGSDASKGPGAKPSPINDTVIFQAPPDREARLQSRIMPAFNFRNAAKTRGGVEGALARMQESIDRIEAKQMVSLNALEENFDAKARRLRSVLSDLGINPGKPSPVPPPGGVGGPFVPANLGADDKSFERQLYRINISRSQVDRLTRTLQDVPVRKPVSGDIDMSSGFGMRVDPFLRAPAMHTGLDMRGDTGDPVRATANGTVTFAGTQGGYGKMIEIEHRNGLSTRYAHLSAIDVKVGQAIKIGQVIGKLGSTGRSTGPHLHYETRVDGEAVDPQKYLRAGIRLGLN
ncbi:MAG: peptidoglycan DD-metalloendopeptidase family protein [Pseudorhodoplanes sp.]